MSGDSSAVALKDADEAKLPLPLTLSDGEKSFCNAMLASTNIGDLLPSWRLADDPLTSTIEGITATDGADIRGRGGNIRNITVNMKGLEGSIPYAIEKCTKLRKLHLNANELEGPIPSGLGQCVRLRKLHLFQNKLIGGLPDEMMRLTELRELYLNSNMLGQGLPGKGLQALPINMGNLISLEKCWLNDNGFVGKIPETIMQCTNLVLLNLSFNDFEGKGELLWLPSDPASSK